MTVIGCQRLAALVSIPFYVLVFPFGALFHALLGSIAVGYAFSAVSSDEWSSFVNQMSPYPMNRLMRTLAILVGIWFFFPMMVCSGLRLIEPEVSIETAAALNALLNMGVFPSSLPEYEAALSRSIGPASASHYVIGMFVTATIPFALGIAAPHFLIFWVFHDLQMRRRKEPAAQLSILYWCLLVIFVIAVVVFYIIEFRYSQDAGYIEPREGFERTLHCFFPVQMGSILLATVWAHFGLSAALSYRSLPSIVEEFLSKPYLAD